MSRNTRILIAAGGTGGHLYPAQALADELLIREPDAAILFVGGSLSTSPYFDRSRFSFKEIPCAACLGASPFRLLKGVWVMSKGVRRSLELIKQFQPDIVVGFGSYYSVPPLVAARLSGVKLMLHESDSLPGKANRWLAPFAHKIGAVFPEAVARLGKQAVEIKMPLRPGYHLGALSKSDARAYFGLESRRTTLLLFGGSQGARRLNELIEESFPEDLQVIHIAGKNADLEQISACYAAKGIKNCVKAFESAMHIAWSASDFFIGRAGAATIAEAIEFEIPGILIPYPHATGGHQEKNADFFCSHIGAGIKMLEPSLKKGAVGGLLFDWVKNGLLEEMRQAIRTHKNDAKRLSFAQLVLETI